MDQQQQHPDTGPITPAAPAGFGAPVRPTGPAASLHRRLAGQRAAAPGPTRHDVLATATTALVVIALAGWSVLEQGASLIGTAQPVARTGR